MENDFKKNNSSSILIFFIPFIITNVLLFFELSASNPYLAGLLKESQQLLDIDATKLNLFMIVIVVLLNTIILLVTFLFIKLLVQLFLKEEFLHEKDLLITLLLSSSLAAVISLLLSAFFSVNYLPLSIITSIGEYLIFIILYRMNVKNNQETVIIATVKLVLLIVNLFFVFRV
ncbi:hypothetical protein [Marinilactibacillus kalidii]|uniref:hypothetical protein n=1 Tax=Marinilactibacillus kalidii TaxID=2820274 RepID=UPI001ABE8B8C|nr:hypothetical protein [Marinilactibacillus kalidii]